MYTIRFKTGERVERIQAVTLTDAKQIAQIIKNASVHYREHCSIAGFDLNGIWISLV